MFWLLAACAPPPEPIDLPPIVLEPGVPWRVPARPPWAGSGWPSVDPADAGIDPAALDALLAYSADRDGDDVDRQGQRTDALVIVRHGQLVVEQYGRGTTPDTPLLTWSVTKSFGSALIGAAVHDGLVHPQDPVCEHVPAMCRPGHDRVRLADLLQMSSGLAWNETYETSPVFSSVMAMLYTHGRYDMADYVAQRPLAHAPGTRWNYSSGDSNLASAALKRPLGERYATYPWDALFTPLGMASAVYERDAAGTHVASSYLYASGRDLARLGQLMLDDGVWQGERLLAPGWVRFSTTLAPSFHSTPVTEEHVDSNPGAQWYVNAGDPERGLAPPWPSLPPDAFGASGHWGKVMWVVPSWDLVVVRLGDDREYACSRPGQIDCEPDPEAAFSKLRFLELLGAAVRPHDPPIWPPPEAP